MAVVARQMRRMILLDDSEVFETLSSRLACRTRDIISDQVTKLETYSENATDKEVTKDRFANISIEIAKTLRTLEYIGNKVSAYVNDWAEALSKMVIAYAKFWASLEGWNGDCLPRTPDSHSESDVDIRQMLASCKDRPQSRTAFAEMTEAVKAYAEKLCMTPSQRRLHDKWLQPTLQKVVTICRTLALLSPEELAQIVWSRAGDRATTFGTILRLGTILKRGPLCLQRF